MDDGPTCPIQIPTNMRLLEAKVSSSYLHLEMYVVSNAGLNLPCTESNVDNSSPPTRRDRIKVTRYTIWSSITYHNVTKITEHVIIAKVPNRFANPASNANNAFTCARIERIF